MKTENLHGKSSEEQEDFNSMTPEEKTAWATKFLQENGYTATGGKKGEAKRMQCIGRGVVELESLEAIGHDKEK